MNLLNESLTDIVYHFTSSDNLIKILKNNSIQFSTALGSDRDLKNRGKFNYLSVTRSKMSGFNFGNAKIVFDGRKLNQKYKSIPLDYWSFKKNLFREMTKKDFLYFLKMLEQEDRIISNDLEILNVSKYIREIHLFALSKDAAAIAIYYAKLRKIPIYVYDNESNYKLQRNPIKSLEKFENPNFEAYKKQNEEKPDFIDYDLAAFISYNNEDAYHKIKFYLVDDDKKEEFDNSIKNIINQYYKEYTPTSYQGLDKIKNSVDDMRLNMTKSNKFLMNLLINDMKKHKTKNLKEYLELKRSKDKQQSVSTSNQ